MHFPHPEFQDMTIEHEEGLKYPLATGVFLISLLVLQVLTSSIVTSKDNVGTKPQKKQSAGY